MFSLLNIRIGFYLAIRQIRRSSKWTTSLIVFVMLLTFLNLVGVSGILVGLIQGIGRGYREQYTGDVFIGTLDTENYIPNSPQIVSFVRSLPQVAVVDPRFVAGGTLEANYKGITDPNQKTNSTGAEIVGIDPATENQFSHIADDVIKGSYLSPDDYDQVLVGAQLLSEYAFAAGPSSLNNVEPGSKLRLTINGVEREVTVKGIVNSRGGNIAQRVFMTNSELQTLVGAQDYSVQEIGIRLKPGEDPSAFESLLVKSGLSAHAKIQTATEAIPSGVAQITLTFSTLGNVIGSIGLVVASITIFIVIFVNALTRRKFIGILKGIGISGSAIEISYIFQSLFYAISGSLVGLLLLYAIVVPLTTAHPIALPLGDVTIYAPLSDTLTRVALLILATMVAGYIPARMIVKKNTLDSILGRN